MNLIDFILICFGNFWMGLTMAEIIAIYKRIQKCPLHCKSARQNLMHEIYANMVVVGLFIAASVAYYHIHH